MIRSFAALQAINPGFDPHHVLSLVVSVAGSREAPEGPREIFYRQLLDRVRAVPGVESAGAINHLPLVATSGDIRSRSMAAPSRAPEKSPARYIGSRCPGTSKPCAYP